MDRHSSSDNRKSRSREKKHERRPRHRCPSRDSHLVGHRYYSRSRSPRTRESLFASSRDGYMSLLKRIHILEKKNASSGEIMRRNNPGTTYGESSHGARTHNEKHYSRSPSIETRHRASPESETLAKRSKEDGLRSNRRTMEHVHRNIKVNRTEIRNSSIGRSRSPSKTLNSSSEEEKDPNTKDDDIMEIDAPLDLELLENLGEEPVPNIRAHDIRQEIATRWNHLAHAGLATDQKIKLTSLYKVPNNCTFDAPKLNPELEACLTEMASKIDHAYMDFQKQIGSGISALGDGLTTAINKLKDTDPVTLKLLSKSFGDAGRLMADLQFRLSQTRRELIKPRLNSSLRKAAEAAPTDDWLFGSDFTSRIKVAKDLDKVATELKPKSTPKESKKTFTPKSSKSSGRQTTGARRKTSLNSYGPSRSTAYKRSGGRRQTNTTRRQ